MFKGLNKDSGPENDLILAAKKGEEQAFGKLYDLYFERIFKFIYFRVSHKETAEDLTEDVFIKAWQRITHVKPESFSGWLYSISKNTVIDHYRQKKIMVDLQEIEGILESEQNVVEEANTVMEQKLFMDLLRKLTPEQQIVIKLKFIEGLENDEISELIARSEGSIRVTQHRAIAKLQELLNEQIKYSSEARKNANAEN
jgi:RNA polymerase sigma-70 factor, ECF subfamily